MSSFNRIIFYAAVLVLLLLLFSLAAYFGMFGFFQNMSFNDITLLVGIVNVGTTVVFAIVATINGLEAKKTRSDFVRPHLSLEPAYFDYDIKTGEIIGFTCLNLVNGGTVARDVEIDFCCKGKCSALYASSVGTNDRVQIWNGMFSELGDNITVNVKYSNMFNKNLEEVLTINIDSIKEAKRKFVPVLNPANSH